MHSVVCDTSPIRYLIQIEQTELLSLLFQTISIPDMVASELLHSSAPALVQAWIAQPPEWIKVVTVADMDDPELRALDPGERAAILLGTLGLLDLAAARGLVDLKEALDRLKGTNFRYRQATLDELLGRH